MHTDLITYIQFLSERDKKNLMERTLKGAEELGELAQKVLPYENAFATNHRFVTANDVLEEAADLSLVLYSIIFKLGFTANDLEEMMKHKARKWDRLQVGEEKYTGRTPYEIHITVMTINIDAFEQACRLLDIKPIGLDLQPSQEKMLMKDVMTSAVHLGTNRSAYEEMKRISECLSAQGFLIAREKIETVPWHPAAPTLEHPEMPKGCYFECHFGVVCPNEDRERLQDIALEVGAHLSRNVLKKIDETSSNMMMTYRMHTGTRESFDHNVTSIKWKLQHEEFEIDKVITEFSIYDTKVSHDAQWILSER
jgi:NTP pyrophosphatase (non-canonical NTP hydrolase)